MRQNTYCRKWISNIVKCKMSKKNEANKCADQKNEQNIIK